MLVNPFTGRQFVAPPSISAKGSANIEIFSNYGEWILLRF